MNSFDRWALRYVVYRYLSVAKDKFGLPPFTEAAFLSDYDAVEYARQMSPGMNCWVVMDTRHKWYEFFKKDKIIFIANNGQVLKEFKREG